MPKEQAVERQKSSPLTTRGKPTKFTPERLQQIINLVERGKSRDEIADILGVTVGSLQVTCSKMGISLRRPKIMNGVCLLKKREPHCENGTVTHHSADQDGRVPLQATEEQLRPQPAEPAVVAKPQQKPATTPDACSAAIRFRYRGIERIDELPLALHTMGQLALEAALREVEIGELITEIITAMVNKELFPLVLDNSDPVIADDPSEPPQEVRP
jgi:hypothetical protein